MHWISETHTFSVLLFISFFMNFAYEAIKNPNERQSQKMWHFSKFQSCQQIRLDKYASMWILEIGLISLAFLSFILVFRWFPVIFDMGHVFFWCFRVKFNWDYSEKSLLGISFIYLKQIILKKKLISVEKPLESRGEVISQIDWYRFGCKFQPRTFIKHTFQQKISLKKSVQQKF